MMTESGATMQHDRALIEACVNEQVWAVVGASTNPAKWGYRIYRVVARGTVSDLPIEWIYYAITSPTGQRASIAFTMEANLVDRFAGADQAFVSEVKILPPQTAARSVAK